MFAHAWTVNLHRLTETKMTSESCQWPGMAAYERGQNCFLLGKKIGLSVTSTHAASLNRTHCIMTLYLCANSAAQAKLCRPQDGEILPRKQLHKTPTFIQLHKRSTYMQLNKSALLDHDSVLLSVTNVVKWRWFISFQCKMRQKEEIIRQEELVW